MKWAARRGKPTGIKISLMKITGRLLSSNGIADAEGAEKQGTAVRCVTRDHLVMLRAHAHGIGFLLTCPHNFTESSSFLFEYIFENWNKPTQYEALCAVLDCLVPNISAAIRDIIERNDF